MAGIARSIIRLSLVGAGIMIEPLYLIYTYYFYYFIMASLILLVAMIGAIVLTMHKGIDVKRQEIFEQNTREFTKTVQKLEVNRKRTSLAIDRLS